MTLLPATRVRLENTRIQALKNSDNGPHRSIWMPFYDKTFTLNRMAVKRSVSETDAVNVSSDRDDTYRSSETKPSDSDDEIGGNSGSNLRSTVFQVGVALIDFSGSNWISPFVINQPVVLNFAGCQLNIPDPPLHSQLISVSAAASNLRCPNPSAIGLPWVKSLSAVLHQVIRLTCALRRMSVISLNL
jgi:hypothetical protein